MKIVYLGIVRKGDATKDSAVVVSEKNLDGVGIFRRQTVGEYLTMFARTVGERTNAGQRQVVDQEENEEYKIHAYGRSEGIVAIAVTDRDYPDLPAQRILGKIADEFLAENPRSAWASDMPSASLPQLKEYIEKYQDPTKIDNITQIQAQLDETKEVLHKTIESVLNRGESLDNLVAKSEDLSGLSKKFYTTAQKQNSCCQVM